MDADNEFGLGAGLSFRSFGFRCSRPGWRRKRGADPGLPVALYI